MKNPYERKIHFRFIGWVSLVLVIPIIGMLFVFNTSFDVISKQIYEKNIMVLGDSAANVRRLINNVDNLFLYISESASINNFLNMDSAEVSGSGISSMLKTQKDLQALSISNDYITNIQVYSPKNDMLMDSTCTAMFIDRYYGQLFSVPGRDLSEWKNVLLDQNPKHSIYPNADYIYQSACKQSILYAKPIHSTGFPASTGKVLIYLDKSIILAPLSNLVKQNEGFAYALNETGENFFSLSASGEGPPLSAKGNFSQTSGYYFEKINNEDYLLTYYRDESTNWVYISGVKQDFVFSKVYDVRLTILLSILFAVLLGAGVALYSARRLSRPIEKAYSVFRTNNIDAKYEDFSTQIDKLLKDNTHMQDEIQEHLPALKADLFHTLLTGSFASGDEILENLSKLGVHLHADSYLVLVVSMNELDTRNSIENISAQKLYINTLIPHIFSGVEYTYDLDFERSAFLISCPAASKESIVQTSEHAAKELFALLEKESPVSISLAGDITQGEQNISGAFCNAYTALYYRRKDQEHAIQWYRENIYGDENSQGYFLEVEGKILSAINRGDSQQVFAVLSEIEKKNYDILNSQNYAAACSFLESMNGILKKVLEFDEKEKHKAIPFLRHIPEQMKNEEEAFSTFFLIKESLMYLAEEQKNALYLSQGTLQQQIKSYVDANYIDPQISLSSVAGVFNITDVYLSSIFKQIVGSNFSKYIEQLRMEKAQALMQDKGLSISEISEGIGYNSVQVFRRAYKRYYGISPASKK